MAKSKNPTNAAPAKENVGNSSDSSLGIATKNASIYATGDASVVLAFMLGLNMIFSTFLVYQKISS